MKQFIAKLPYFNKRIGKQATKGQSLVEFALVSVLLFSLIFGILEMGRLMFIFSQVSAAAQEGARYAVTYPREITSTANNAPDAGGNCPYPCGLVKAGGAESTDPCNIIAWSRAKVTLLPPNDVSIEVGYDKGDQNLPGAPFDDIDGFSKGAYRAVVTATYQFHFLVGILDTFLPDGLAVRMVAARTIHTEQTDWQKSEADRVRCSTDVFNPPTPTPVNCQLIHVTRSSHWAMDLNGKKWGLAPRYKIYDPYGNEITSGLTVKMQYWSNNTPSKVLVTTITMGYNSTIGAWVNSQTCAFNDTQSNWPQGVASYTIYTTLNISGAYTFNSASCSVTTFAPAPDAPFLNSFAIPSP
jgi:hypothetical protein